METDETQQRWIRFLTRPQPMPAGSVDLETFQTHQKESLRNIIGEALCLELLPEPLLIQFVHIQPDEGRPFFGITTVAKKGPLLKSIIAYSAVHTGYVQKKRISFFRNASSFIRNRGIIAVFGRELTPMTELSNADCFFNKVDSTEAPKLAALPTDEDFKDVPDAGEYSFLSDSAFQSLLNKPQAGILLKQPGSYQLTGHVETIIGEEHVRDYLTHLAPMLARGQVVYCAPALYDYEAHTPAVRTGTGGCVFLFPADQSLIPHLEQLYLFTHKLCSSASAMSDVAATLVSTEAKALVEDIAEVLVERGVSQGIVDDVIAYRRRWENQGFYRRSYTTEEELVIEDIVAKSELPVVITGQSGTGKETTAKQIAERSNRSKKLLRTVNCATLSPNKAESHLFGHVKGSFTDASSHSVGLILAASGYKAGPSTSNAYFDNWLETANKGIFERDKDHFGEKCYALKEGSEGGTLILDEFGALDTAVQEKILRAVDGHPISPLGWAGNGFLPSVRIICITNQSLENIKRKDLIHRIGGFYIEEPRLSEKLQDVEAALEDRFTLLKLAGEKQPIKFKLNERVKRDLLDPDFLITLTGNFRELKWLVQRACIYAYADNKRRTINKGDLEKAKKSSLPASAFGQPALFTEPHQLSSKVSADHPQTTACLEALKKLMPNFGWSESWDWKIFYLKANQQLSIVDEPLELLDKFDAAFKKCARNPKALTSALRANTEDQVSKWLDRRREKYTK